MFVVGLGMFVVGLGMFVVGLGMFGVGASIPLFKEILPTFLLKR